MRVGSTVYLTAGGIRQREDVMSGGSYESSNDQRLHFGLGQSTSVDSVEIHWASTGSVERVNLPRVDRYFVIEEGKGIIPSVYDGISKQMAPESEMLCKPSRNRGVHGDRSRVPSWRSDTEYCRA